MNKKWFITACFSLLSVLFPWVSYGVTTTGSLAVSANSVTACTFKSARMDFGTGDYAQPTGISVNGSIVINCTTGTPYEITLDAGLSGGTILSRAMLASGSNLNPNHLAYQLYTNPGRTIVWGDGTTDGEAVSSSATNNADITTIIYGRIGGAQSLATGSYSDTVTVTVTY